MLQRCFRASAGKHVGPDQPIDELGLASLEIAAVHSSILEAFDMDADDFPITSLFDGDTTLNQIVQELAYEDTSLSASHDASRTETWDENGDEYDDNDVAKEFASGPVSTVTKDNITKTSFVGNVCSIVLQTIAVLLVPVVTAIASYPVAFSVTYMTTVELSSLSSGTVLLILVMCVPLVAILNTVFFTTVLIVMKWLLVGKQDEIHDGRPVWGVGFAGRWIVRQYAQFCWTFTQWAWLDDTELMCVLHRCLGSTIGKDVELTAGMIEDFDLVTIGNGSSVSGMLNTETIEHGKQVLGSIEIGSNCAVSGDSLIDQQSRLADDVSIKDQTMVPRGSVLEGQSVWQGHPAKRVVKKSKDDNGQTVEEEGEAEGAAVDLESQETNADVTTHLLKKEKTSTVSKGSFTAFRLLIVLVVSPYILAIEAATAISLGYFLWAHGGVWLFAALIWTLPTASFVMSVLIAVVAKWVLLGRIEEGRWPVYGRFYRHKWFVNHLVEEHVLLWQRIGLLFGSPIVTLTICQIVVLRMFGSSIGKIGRVDLSMFVCYDLLEVEDGGLLGGGTSVDVFDEHDGFLYGRRVHVGKAAYTGTRAVLLAGAHLEDGAAVAAYSITDGTVSSGRVCIGRKTFRMSIKSEQDPEPDKDQMKDEMIGGMIACLFAITGGVFVIWLTVVSLQHITPQFVSGPFTTAAVFVVTYTTLTSVVFPFHSFIMTVMSKYCLAPSFKEGSYAYGSSWRLRGIMAWTVLLNNMYRSWIVGAVGGTWIELVLYRLLGAKIGTNAYIDSIWLFEPDLVRMGDGVTINKLSCVSPHNYKVDSAEFGECAIGDGCVIGTSSTFSGSTCMYDGAELDSFSMPLRGAVVTFGRWVGYPAMPQTNKRRARSKKVVRV